MALNHTAVLVNGRSPEWVMEHVAPAMVANAKVLLLG